MKILISGACGFVGSTLTECLLARMEGVEIVGLDNLIRPGSETNRGKIEKLGVRLVHADLRAASDIEGLPACDWVIDAAANPSVLAGLSGIGASRRLFEHNLVGTGNLLEYCRAHKSGLLLLSSSRVYSIPALCAIPLSIRDRSFVLDPSAPLPSGLSQNGITVDFPTTAPLSLYGATKLASEILALEFGAAFDFPVWITRCGVLAGAGQFGTTAQGIFSYWINAHAHRRPMRYIGFEGSGYQARDAFHPRDLAALLMAQIHATRESGPRIYTAGGGLANTMSLARLTDWCDQRFGRHAPAADLEPRPYDIPWMAMDNAAASVAFNWRIETPLTTILDEIARHADDHPDWLDVSQA
jgi:CDP-paratose 2-epimerase